MRLSRVIVCAVLSCDITEQTGERFERLNVKIFITDKHLLFWDESTTKAVRIEPLPIMGVYELLRYDIVHQRVDDMLMCVPIPHTYLFHTGFHTTQPTHYIIAMRIAGTQCR